MSKFGGLSVQNCTVYVNIYDLHENNDFLYQFGLGLYHSGVHIGREEYTFGILMTCAPFLIVHDGFCANIYF